MTGGGVEMARDVVPGGSPLCPGAIDTHAHLTDPCFAADLDAVLLRAREAGLAAVIDVGDGVESSIRCVAHAARHELLFAAVGIHPQRAAETSEGELGELGRLVAAPRVVAVGETGLDYHRGRSSRGMQERLFREQLLLSVRAGLPAIVHCRDAWDDLMAILREMQGGGLRGVVHCFSGSDDDAEELVGLGWHVSFAGPLTYPKNDGLRETAARLPVGRILMETDCPYLAPQPVRGKRNEPCFVAHTAAALARARGAEPGEVVARTAENARELFTKIPLLRRSGKASDYANAQASSDRSEGRQIPNLKAESPKPKEGE